MRPTIVLQMQQPPNCTPSSVHIFLYNQFSQKMRLWWLAWPADPQRAGRPIITFPESLGSPGALFERNERPSLASLYDMKIDGTDHQHQQQQTDSQ